MIRVLPALLLLLSLSSCGGVDVNHYANQQPQLNLAVEAPQTP